MSLSQSGTIPKDGKQKGYFVVPHRKDGKKIVIARHEAILNIERWNEIDSGRHYSQKRRAERLLRRTAL
jgi:hypothetical protein